MNARDQAQAEIEQLKASNPQLLTASGREAAEASMVELHRQLKDAKRQLADQGSVGSVCTLTEQCKELEDNLRISNQRLLETCDACGLTQMQTRLDVMTGERDTALNREQELLAGGRKLEAQYKERQVQLATTKAELESKQRQYEREHEFAQGQKAEVDRLKADLKEVWNELKAKKAELGNLQAQVPPVQTMAQYQTMPPGQFQGSPMQTSTMPQGHYSPMVVPYAAATNLTASPGQVSTMAGFPFGSPAQGPQVHGSPQLQGHHVFLRQPIFVPSGTQHAPPQQVQSQPKDPVVSSAGSTE